MSFIMFMFDIQSFTEPSNATLLPDELPHPYQRPYTLVLALNDLLIHTEYDVMHYFAHKDRPLVMYRFDVVLQRNTGWKYHKRPGVDALLVHMLDHFEIVLFTSENAMVRARIKVLLFATVFKCVLCRVYISRLELTL